MRCGSIPSYFNSIPLASRSVQPASHKLYFPFTNYSKNYGIKPSTATNLGQCSNPYHS